MAADDWIFGLEPPEGYFEDVYPDITRIELNQIWARELYKEIKKNRRRNGSRGSTRNRRSTL